LVHSNLTLIIARPLLSIIHPVSLIPAHIQHLINADASSFGFFSQFPVAKAPDDMARVDADFQDDPIASLSLLMHTGHCSYTVENSHYDVHDPSEDIKCALRSFEQSVSILCFDE
jgi:hypothetical protein